jgi:hypothetical protein
MTIFEFLEKVLDVSYCFDSDSSKGVECVYNGIYCTICYEDYTIFKGIRLTIYKTIRLKPNETLKDFIDRFKGYILVVSNLDSMPKSFKKPMFKMPKDDLEVELLLASLE